MAMTTPLPVPYVQPRAQRGSGTQVDPDLDRVRKLSRVLDNRFVDPLIGLVLPGVGDLAGSLLGLYTVAIAIRRKLSPVIIARMLMNLALDAALGIVPFLGDAADWMFKANRRNLALLEARVDNRGKATARDWMAVVGAALAFVAAIGLVIYAIVSVVRAIA